jgi:hypothetical protein
MADEIPPAPSESPDDVTKSETIRITLPPKSEQPAVKRETVRINVPGKPVPPAGTAPKKETSKLPTSDASVTPATGSKPFVPPPPAPKPLPTAPLAAKPIAGVNPPKPPTLGARPTVPLKPAPAPVPSGVAQAPEPVTQKSAAPKKETARITLPPEGAKPPLPKATVKMQQTQPLAPRPSAIQQAPSVIQQVAAAPAGVVNTGDPLVGPLSIAALVAAIAALLTIYLAHSGTVPVSFP